MFGEGELRMFPKVEFGDWTMGSPSMHASVAVGFVWRTSGVVG